MTIALLSVACAARVAGAFHPWALNDSKAFVFPRIAEKRNRGRRERLAAALSKDSDAIRICPRNNDFVAQNLRLPRQARHVRDAQLWRRNAVTISARASTHKAFSRARMHGLEADVAFLPLRLNIGRCFDWLQWRLSLSIERVSAAATQADQRGAQEVLPDGSGAARDQKAHSVKTRGTAGPHTHEAKPH